MSIRLTLPVRRLLDHTGPTGGGIEARGGAEGGTLAVKEKAGNLALITYEALELKRNRPRDVAALHAMQAARPLKPPPHDFGERRPVAGLLAVREDRKAGVQV